MLGGLCGAHSGIGVLRAPVAEQSFRRPGGVETSWAPPSPGDPGVRMSWASESADEARARWITIDPSADHASNDSPRFTQPSAAGVRKNIGRCECDCSKIERYVEFRRMCLAKFGA